MVITSRENSTIKELIKLKDKKYRKEKFIIEGYKTLDEAIKENANIDLIVFEENFSMKEKYSKYRNIEVSEKIFLELTDVKTPQGVLAVVSKKENKNIDYSKDYLLILDGIQDPGNLGTIIRTADSCDLGQIIVSKNTVDSYSPKVTRSTMGSTFRINVIESENLADTIEEVKQHGFEIITTSLDATESIYDIDYNKKAIIIGNEANGVSSEIQNLSDQKVKIPMFGRTESLNAAVAASIMMYEYVRQKITKK